MESFQALPCKFWSFRPSPPIYMSVCVCIVPPHVISPSGQPPHQTSLQAVPRCRPSIWLCGMSQPFIEGGVSHFNQASSLPCCSASAAVNPWFFSFCGSVSCFPYRPLGMNRRSDVALHTCGSYCGSPHSLQCLSPAPSKQRCLFFFFKAVFIHCGLGIWFVNKLICDFFFFSVRVVCTQRLLVLGIVYVSAWVLIISFNFDLIWF